LRLKKKKSDPARWRTAVSALALAALIAATVWAVQKPEALAALAPTRQLPVYCVERADKKIAISFDAAWGNEDTQTLIDILNAHDVRATFFLVGGWVDKYPDSVKALADAGNEVMNHSDTHPHLAQLSAHQVQAEVSTCADKIEAITGVHPTLFRCPYGEYNDTVIKAIRAIGIEPIQWDVDSLDWKGISADEITKRVLDGVKPGSIVLFHNAAEHTPEALAGIIEALQAEGYEFVPISELLLQGDTTIDNAGCQHPAKSAS
jgi:polysaccharide deacetylase family sporulation protein PdaB